MKPNRNWRARVLMPMLLLTLASGCAHNSAPPLPAAVVAPAAIPALPVQARQPTPPAICLPTCSAGLMRLRMELLDMLMKPEQQVKPASAATAR